MMLTLGERDLTLSDFQNILTGNERITIAARAKERVKKSFSFLDSFHKEKIIYGINTGLGPMAQYRIDEEDRIKLQYNAIRSHASGSGAPVDPVYVRSAMVVLLNNLLRGHSGIHPLVVELIAEMINRNIVPVVPEHGGVGASGDLVQLAHIALALIGEGEVWVDGKIIPSEEALSQNKLKPVKVHIREGLSLINGTCFMTGTGIVNLMNARNLLSWSLMASTVINEIVNSFGDSFSEELNRVKLHGGQKRVAETVRKMLKDSKLIRSREEHFYNNNHGNTRKIADKVQEYYSLRCIPQILGPILDTIEYSVKVLLNEANSCCDNPVIDHTSRNIYHGGNFHGDYVSLEMDKLKISIAKLSLLIDRQINFLMNEKLNNILPPFVNLGKTGVNFGMQGAQFTSASTAAENQSLSFPNYVHSIPNNNDNQDIVSMGTNSALLAKRVIDNTYQILAIEMISLAQAVDYLKVRNKLSTWNRNIFDEIRKLVPCFVEDTVKYLEIKKIKDYLCTRYIDIIVK